ncbi:MAG: ABC transporter ATP-binding protein [Patescibacteria group bacterium]
MSMLKIKNLTKVYGSGHTAVRAVENVSLNIEEGEIVLIMGPSGSGKTTLITMAGALLKPTSGEVIINGGRVSDLKEKDLARVRLNKLGFVFQSFNLLSSLGALENVAVPLIAAGVRRKAALAQARIGLEKLGLGKRLGNLPRDLSGGEKQRVSVARAMVNNPKLILADEPTANLDSKTGREVMELLCSTACRERRTVVIVSHDQRLKDIAHRVIWFEDGKITQEEKGGHPKVCKHNIIKN